MSHPFMGQSVCGQAAQIWAYTSRVWSWATAIPLLSSGAVGMRPASLRALPIRCSLQWSMPKLARWASKKLANMTMAAVGGGIRSAPDSGASVFTYVSLCERCTRD